MLNGFIQCDFFFNFWECFAKSRRQAVGEDLSFSVFAAAIFGIASACNCVEKAFGSIIAERSHCFGWLHTSLGGVDCHYLSSKTMEANVHKGLYFVVEVLDVTGWLGGYNFQWAWSSGFVVGQYAWVVTKMFLITPVLRNDTLPCRGALGLDAIGCHDEIKNSHVPIALYRSMLKVLCIVE